MIDPKKIWSSSQLPTLPSVAVKLLDLTKNPDAEIRDVVDCIKTDPAISAKILKAANSTFFALKSHVTSIDRAVPLLGTTVSTSLALSFSLVEAAMTRGPTAKHYSAYWLQSIVNAGAAEAICSTCEEGLSGEYFLAGLLMDIGRLAMLKTIADQYLPVVQSATDWQRDLHDVETQMLGFNHAEIGVQLMKHWNLPETLHSAVEFHHAPLDVIAAASASADYPLIRAMAVVASLGDYFAAANKGLALQRLRTLTQAFYHFSETQLEEFLTQVKIRIDQTAELFSVNTEDLGDPSDLMAQANEQLATIALRAHVEKTQVAARHQEVEKEKNELQSQNKQLQKQASHDPLTGIYNRQFFDETLAKEVERCCRNGTPVGILFLDVDHFKQLNDRFGHQFGDLVLKRVAASIAAALRGADTLARYGGEEFVVLVNQPTEKGLQKLAEKTRQRVEAEQIVLDNQPVPVTISVGATMTVPRRDELTVGTHLIEVADQAMYEAKQAGRNQVRVRTLTPEMDRRLLHEVTQRRFSRWLVTRGAIDIATASKALLQCPADKRRVGDLGQSLGLFDAEQVERILQEQEQTNLRFGEAAIQAGHLDEAQLAELLALQQENPRCIAAALIKVGALDAPRASALLQQFCAERSAALPQLALS